MANREKLTAFADYRLPQVLHAAAELYPWVKTGGLGDVAGALPVALRRIGLDARVLLPGYRPVLAALPGARTAGRIE